MNNNYKNSEILNYDDFLSKILMLKDPKYLDFHKTISCYQNLEMIGVRTPEIHKISREIASTIGCNKNMASNFVLSESRFYEEKIVKGLVIGYLKIDYHFILELLSEYLKQIDSWEICDLVVSNLKIIKKKQEEFLSFINDCLSTNEEYIVRFGLVILKCYYVNDKYIDYVISKIKDNHPDSYYINMAKAWLVCECFIKYSDKTISLFDEKKLTKFVNNKAISKINDSFRVNKVDKDYLKQKRIL